MRVRTAQKLISANQAGRFQLTCVDYMIEVSDMVGRGE